MRDDVIAGIVIGAVIIAIVVFPTTHVRIKSEISYATMENLMSWRNFPFHINVSDVNNSQITLANFSAIEVQKNFTFHDKTRYNSSYVRAYQYNYNYSNGLWQPVNASNYSTLVLIYKRYISSFYENSTIRMSGHINVSYFYNINGEINYEVGLETQQGVIVNYILNETSFQEITKQRRVFAFKITLTVYDNSSLMPAYLYVRMIARNTTIYMNETSIYTFTFGTYHYAFNYNYNFTGMDYSNTTFLVGATYKFYGNGTKQYHGQWWYSPYAITDVDSVFINVTYDYNINELPGKVRVYYATAGLFKTITAKNNGTLKFVGKRMALLEDKNEYTDVGYPINASTSINILPAEPSFEILRINDEYYIYTLNDVLSFSIMYPVVELHKETYTAPWWM